MPGEAGTEVEVFCVMGVIRYRISQIDLPPEHNWIMSKREKVPHALAVSPI